MQAKEELVFIILSIFEIVKKKISKIDKIYFGDFDMGFSENFKVLRKAQKIDQKVLAKHLNVSSKTISHWETGYTEPSICQLIAISKFFDVSIDELVDNK